MKYHEFYKKQRTGHLTAGNPLFSKNGWSLMLTTAVAVLIEPLIIIYKNRKLDHLSLHVYLQVLQYLLLIVVPFLALLLWVDWRDWIKRSSGYVWLGKFEVISKRASFAFCYLLLAPGDDHKLKVERDLFDKVRVGDHIQVRRDALGGIQEITKVTNFSSRLARASAKRASGGKLRGPQG